MCDSGNLLVLLQVRLAFLQDVFVLPHLWMLPLLLQFIHLLHYLMGETPQVCRQTNMNKVIGNKLSDYQSASTLNQLVLDEETQCI